MLSDKNMDLGCSSVTFPDGVVWFYASVGVIEAVKQATDPDTKDEGFAFEASVGGKRCLVFDTDKESLSSDRRDLISAIEHFYMVIGSGKL